MEEHAAERGIKMYKAAAFGVYVNFFLLGMFNIILISNMGVLSEKWGTDSSGISFLLSVVGIGKILSFTIAGRLSDKFGRKPLISFSSLALGLFFIGIPLAPTYEIAFILALLAGVGNSTLDTGAYPAVTELFPKSAGSASVMIKAFVSFGSAVLPFMILFLSGRDLFFGYTFFIPAAMYILTTLIILKASFPDHRYKPLDKTSQGNGPLKKFSTEPNFRKEGWALILVGFTSVGLYNVSQIWLPSYGQEVVGMSTGSAIKLLSYYNIGAILSVLTLAVLMKKFLRPVTIITIYPILTFFSLVTILTIKIPIVMSVAVFLLGLSTGGIYQLAIAIGTELFWQRKGRVTGIIATAGALATVVMPFLTGLLAKTGNMSIIFIFDTLLSLVGFASASYVYYRYGKVVGKQGEAAAEGVEESYDKRTIVNENV